MRFAAEARAAITRMFLWMVASRCPGGLVSLWALLHSCSGGSERKHGLWLAENRRNGAPKVDVTLHLVCLANSWLCDLGQRLNFSEPQFPCL